LVKNIISAFFSRSFVALSNFALLLLLTHYLGSGVVGQLSILVLNLAIIQTVSEIYTGSSLVYFIPSHSISKLYKQGFLFSLLCSITLNLGFIIFNNVQNEFWPHLFLLSLILTLNSFKNVILLGRQKIKAYNLLVLMQPLLMLLLVGFEILLINEKSITGYILALYLSYGLVLMVSSILVMRVIKADEAIQVISIKKVIKNGIINQLGNLAHTLSNRFNYYLLGSMALVGVYASSTSLIEGVWVISGSISPLLLSYVANQKDSERNAQLTLLLAKLCLILGFSCILILIVLPVSFFTYLLGNDFVQTKTVMIFLSPGILCLSFSSILSHYFSGLGLQKIQLLANASGLLITLCLAWPLISLYGLFGACYAASMAYFVQALVLTAIFVKQNKISLRELLSLKLKLGLLR
jgi:O-antigen/teichoic acid export membrane protein